MAREPLIDQKFLEKLERLTIYWQKSFPGLVGGHNDSRFAGPGQEFLDHRRRLAARLERPAAQTGAVPGVQSVMRPRIELDILALGRAGVTDRAAEYAGCFHRDIKDAVVGGIALGERVVHHIGRWELGHGRIIEAARRARRRNSGSKFRGVRLRAGRGPPHLRARTGYRCPADGA